MLPLRDQFPNAGEDTEEAFNLMKTLWYASNIHPNDYTFLAGVIEDQAEEIIRLRDEIKRAKIMGCEE